MTSCPELLRPHIASSLPHSLISQIPKVVSRGIDDQDARRAARAILGILLKRPLRRHDQIAPSASTGAHARRQLERNSNPGRT